MRHFVVVAFAALLNVGCTSALDAYCGKAKECAQKAGTAFSETECKQTNQADREKAASKNCASQWDDVAGCLAGATCGSTNEQLRALCGAKSDAFNKCMN